MSFKDFINLLSFFPLSFFNDFEVYTNDKECTDVQIDFKRGIINFLGK